MASTSTYFTLASIVAVSTLSASAYALPIDLPDCDMLPGCFSDVVFVDQEVESLDKLINRPEPVTPYDLAIIEGGCVEPIFPEPITVAVNWHCSATHSDKQGNSFTCGIGGQL